MSAMGKGWAKGLTAATDARVARAADAHRGMRYERRTPIDECAWPKSSSRLLPLEWSDTMAYLVGLTATDGCLITGRRQINFKSEDRALVDLYLTLLGRTNTISSQPTRSGGTVYHSQFGDALWYEWLRGVGLSPRKSLTIGAIAVPEAFLFPLVRGLLDGDGSVINQVYRADTADRPDYYWEYLMTQFASASEAHLTWLEDRVGRATGLHGNLSQVTRRIPDARRHPFFQLRYGKRASLVLLPLLYPRGAPCLARKRDIWREYARRHDISELEFASGPGDVMAAMQV